jgi:hypothetical protein
MRLSIFVGFLLLSLTSGAQAAPPKPSPGDLINSSSAAAPQAETNRHGPLLEYAKHGVALLQANKKREFLEGYMVLERIDSLKKSGKWEAAIKKFSDDKAAGILVEMKEMIPGIEENPPVELNQPGKMWIGPTENRR